MTNICVIFDLDGTLVDSEVLCNQAFIDLLPQVAESAESLAACYRGKKLALILGDLERRLGHTLPRDFELHYRRRVAELFESRLKPTPGAIAMLKGMTHASCVASSGPPEKIQLALRVSGLAPFFGERVFSAYAVQSWKPDPGLFLHAADALGFRPGQCVVVEDSEVGLAAAEAAGMHAFHYAPSGIPVVGAKSHVVFGHMAELPRLLDALALAL